MLIDYIRSQTHFHAKTTVSSVTSKLRCMGDYLVQEGVWTAHTSHLLIIQISIANSTTANAKDNAPFLD